MESFKHLGLSNQVLKVISELGFEKPSEIQEQAIPKLIDGYHDFLGLAPTGTGKTAAFGLPILERIDPQLKHTQALILAPTRELGQQIAEQLEIFSKYLDKVNVLAVYGGAPISNQIRALRKPQHVIIATPGRLIDLIQREAVNLEELEYLVLDEADEMLNMGFKKELDKILSYTPEEKLIWLFSATMSGEITRIIRKYMDDPVEVRLNLENEVNTNIEHQFTLVRDHDKTEALTRFLDLEPDIRGVVFCRTKRETQQLADDLSIKGYRADSLHGDLSQRQRDKVMRMFKNHELQVLVATDIAARGIDVNDLTHVFHFNLPDDLAYYTHRAGRTARAGKKGISLTFLDARDKYKIGRLSKQLDISFERVMVPGVEDIYKIKMENWSMEVLNKTSKGKLDQELIDKITLLFGNLSKEELIAKVMMLELEKLNLNSARDLNDKYQPRQRREYNNGYNRGGRNGYDRGSRNGHDRGDGGRRDRRNGYDREEGEQRSGGRRRSRHKKKY